MSGEVADETVDIQLVRGAEVCLSVGDGLLLIVHQFGFGDAFHVGGSIPYHYVSPPGLRVRRMNRL